jgi:hypothetical protein
MPMRLAGSPSWRISEDRWPEALMWLYGFVPPSASTWHRVAWCRGRPMLSRCRTRAPARLTELASGWLAWWRSLIELPPLSPPFDPAHPPALLAFGPPDLRGLAEWPVLRRAVTRRWRQAYDWHNARMKAGLEAGLHHDARTGEVVAEMERELGRKAWPFSLDLVLLPVRDEQVRQAGADRYLVPERVHDGPQWPGLLRGLLIPRA